MNAHMEDPAQRALGIQMHITSLVECGALRRADDRNAALLALQSLDPHRRWHRIDGSLHSILATDETPPTIYDPCGIEQLHSERGETLPLAHAARLLLAWAKARDTDEYEVSVALIDGMERVAPSVDPPVEQFGSMAHAWDRYLRGYAYFPDTGCSPMNVSTDPTVWCDSRYRCLVCPGGMGPGGQGYTHSHKVPCTDPVRHMAVFNLVLAQQFYLDGASPCRLCPTMLRQKPCHGDARDRVADALGLYQPSITCDILLRTQGCPAFCQACNYTGGKGTHGLVRYVKNDTRDLEQTKRQRAQRGGTTIIWCDKRYRCPECNPTGTTRARNVGCKNPAEHMPQYSQGFRGTSRVHFVTTNAKTDLDRDILYQGLENGCVGCRNVLTRALARDHA